MTDQPRPLKVFLCHASADKVKVRELYRYLRRQRGIRPWLDEIDLMGGQDWEEEIQKALESSDAVIICLTKNSVSQEGYNQKEMKFALDKALEMPEGRIFLIPVRLEECEVPRALRRYQWVDIFDRDGYQKLMRSLRARLPPPAPVPSVTPIPEPPAPTDESENPLPTWVVVLLNVVLIVVISVLLGDRIAAPCVSLPLVSALSVASITLMVFHIVWRFAYPAMSRNPEGMMELPFVRVPLSVLIGLLNAIHPGKVGNSLLGIFFLFVLLSSWFLNLYPNSPFYTRAQPFTIQSFSVQQALPPVIEEIAPGDEFTMAAGESILVEVKMLGEAQVECTWSILTKPNTTEIGCSIDYSALTAGVDDILTVYVQPICGIRGKSENLFIAVQP